MDIQVVLVFILALLAINLIIVGVYVVLVLRELRETISKANSVLDNVHKASGFLSNPLGAFSGIINAVVDGYKAVKSIKSIRSLTGEDD